MDGDETTKGAPNEMRWVCHVVVTMATRWDKSWTGCQTGSALSIQDDECVCNLIEIRCDYGVDKNWSLASRSMSHEDDIS